jgi:cytoskeletal protein RodZ
MFDDETSRARRPRWIIGLVVAAALALGAMTAVALGQTETTPTETETTTTETSPAEEPTIPEGFDEEDCEITEQPDGSTQVTCQREESQSESQTETSETSTAAGTAETATDETTTEVVVPVGGTGAGLGGTDGDDGSAMPILIGIGGLLMAFGAAALARRRHFG